MFELTETTMFLARVTVTVITCLSDFFLFLGCVLFGVPESLDLRAKRHTFLKMWHTHQLYLPRVPCEPQLPHLCVDILLCGYSSGLEVALCLL